MSRPLLPIRGRVAGAAVAALCALGAMCVLSLTGVIFNAAGATPAPPTTTAAPTTTSTTAAPVPTTSTTVAPTTTVAPPPPTTAAPRPTTVPGQEATVTIPSLGISLPVVEGGQSVIDMGIVAHYVGADWLPPVPAGSAGTYWLAAHHSTHGDPFGRLPDIHQGASVIVTTVTGHTFTYTVTDMEVVGTIATYDSVYGTNPSLPRILLQTCLGATQRLLVHGTLTSAS
jgi:LPXTG-site transpeptidase (sortase) family protein